MDIAQLQRIRVDLLSSYFDEGVLDSQFHQLQLLQDANNPGFVLEVVSLFFQDTERLLTELTMILTQRVVDFAMVDAHVHQLKGSSGSIGAARVRDACVIFRNYCQGGDREGCIRYLLQVKHEFSIAKSKLETLFKVEEQILAAGGSLP